MKRRISFLISLCLVVIMTGMGYADDKTKATPNAKPNGEVTEGDMTASDGVKIHYYTKGKGSPVILIHGYTGSAAGNWLANGIFYALAKNHMVVAIDCRNHGKR